MDFIICMILIIICVGSLLSWAFSSWLGFASMPIPYILGFGIPITLVVLFFVWIAKSSKKEAEQKKAEEAKAAAARSTAQKALEEAISRGDDDARYKALVTLYKNNPVTLKIADLFAFGCILEMRTADSSHARIKWECDIFPDTPSEYDDIEGVWRFYHSFRSINQEVLWNFYQENMRPVPTDEAEAFMRAVVECAGDMIKKTASSYGINETDSLLEISQREQGTGFRLIYDAPNKKYIPNPPAEW